jgi:diacylglycerol kinase (ATP)
VSRRVCVILNPAAGKGKGTKVEGALRRAFSAVGVTDVRLTTARGDEQRLAREAVDDGVDTLVAVGGDGTWSNVANALIAARADVRLALGAAGTGNDFVKTVGAPATDFDATARLAVEGPDMCIDVGCIEDRYFLNVAGFGFDTAVLEDVATFTRLKGGLVYAVSALRQLFSYEGVDIRVTSSTASSASSRYLMLIIANGRNFGGAFRIAPQASLVDGRLDAIAIATASPLRRVSLFAAAARGTHMGRAGVCSERSAQFTLTFTSPPAYETDGEYHRARSATLDVRCIPGALRVVTPLAALTPTAVPSSARSFALHAGRVVDAASPA